jgi:hypothetical protein
MRQVKFAAASRDRLESRNRYPLSSREAYVLRSAPIRGLSHGRGEAASGRVWMIWMVRDENLSNAVEGLLQRGLLARRVGEGPAYADLTAEGRRAIEVGRIKPLR